MYNPRLACGKLPCSNLDCRTIQPHPADATRLLPRTALPFVRRFKTSRRLSFGSSSPCAMTKTVRRAHTRRGLTPFSIQSFLLSTTTLRPPFHHLPCHAQSRLLSHTVVFSARPHHLPAIPLAHGENVGDRHYISAKVGGRLFTSPLFVLEQTSFFLGNTSGFF